MTQQVDNLDQEKVKQVAEQVFGLLGGALVAGTIYLGDHLGLYRALVDTEPMTSEALARKTHLHERWVREWLHGQAAAGLITYCGEGRFTLSPEAAMVLAKEMSPFFLAGGLSGFPQQMAVFGKIPDAFRSGIGLRYDVFGPEGAQGVERLLAPWFRTALIPVALPKLDGVLPKLERGAKVADVGCGAGVALIELAKTFPHSTFHGYEISKYALARAEANKTEAGVHNVTFHDANADGLPADGSFDLVTSFDCIHDMANPVPVIRAIRKALKPDGTWFVADINCCATFEENLASNNPLLPLLYGFSVLCCMSSSLSEPGGAGLGTVGFSEPVARAMASDAGFTRFNRHDFENPINAYYEVRP